MRKLMIALVALFIATAHAAEIKVAEFSQYQLSGMNHLSQEFQFNSELGRAWINFTVSNFDPDSMPDEYRVKVAGLYFDKTEEAVKLDFEGQTYVCAQLKRGRVFRTPWLKETNACKFEQRTRIVTYDDGYEIKKTEKVDVFIVVK